MWERPLERDPLWSGTYEHGTRVAGLLSQGTDAGPGTAALTGAPSPLARRDPPPRAASTPAGTASRTTIEEHSMRATLPYGAGDVRVEDTGSEGPPASAATSPLPRRRCG